MTDQQFLKAMHIDPQDFAAPSDSSPTDGERVVAAALDTAMDRCAGLRHELERGKAYQASQQRCLYAIAIWASIATAAVIGCALREWLK